MAIFGAKELNITWGTEVSNALDNSGVQYCASLLNNQPCINLLKAIR